MPSNSTARKINSVNREKQTDLLKNRLEKLRQGYSEFEVILHWFGIPGIGKTTLGLMIENRCREISVPFSRVDFNPDLNPKVFQYSENGPFSESPDMFFSCDRFLLEKSS